MEISSFVRLGAQNEAGFPSNHHSMSMHRVKYSEQSKIRQAGEGNFHYGRDDWNLRNVRTKYPKRSTEQGMVTARTVLKYG